MKSQTPGRRERKQRDEAENKQDAGKNLQSNSGRVGIRLDAKNGLRSDDQGNLAGNRQPSPRDEPVWTKYLGGGRRREIVIRLRAWINPEAISTKS